MLRKNETSNHGNSNNISNGDITQTIINYNSEHSIEKLPIFFKDIDNEVKKFTSEVLDKYGKPTLFKSETIFTSLISMGIPLKVSLEALQKIPNEIQSFLKKNFSNNSQTTEPFSTKNIRKIVSDILFTLDDKYRNTKKSNWGTMYSRRYGNPNEAIRVINQDFSEEQFSYNFIKRKLIPHIIRKCYQVDDEVDIKNLFEIDADSLEEISEEIVEKVKYLNLYAIDYKTLFRLAYNIACQPPHPWLSDVRYRNKQIEYNIEKAQLHYEKFADETGDNIDKLNTLCHSIVECLDHSCAALLTRYNLFIGAGRFKPLNYLIKYLELEDEEEGNNLIWYITDIRKLEDDLTMNNIQISAFKDKLKKIKHHTINYQSEKNIKKLFFYSKKIHQLCYKIIENDISFQKKLTRVIENPKVFSSDYESIVRQIITSIKGIKIKNVITGHGGMLASHRIERSFFKYIQPIIYFAAIITDDTDNKETIKLQINKCNQIIEATNFCNCSIIICSHDFRIEEIKSALKNKYDDRNFIFIITLKQLVSVYNSKNSLEEFIEIMESFAISF